MDLKGCFFQKVITPGMQKGLQGSIWIMKILIPVSLLTTLLEWTGAIHFIDSLLRPVMGFLNLPGAAAFPLLIGILVGIYAGIAVMAALPFSVEQITLMGIFMTICHMLIQEGIIQGKSGLHFIPASLLRIGAATLAVLSAAPFLQSSSEVSVAASSWELHSPSFFLMLHAWSFSVIKLGAKIWIIMTAVMILMEILRITGGILYAVRLFSPILRIIGLSPRVVFLWISGTVFGLSYSAAMIMEELRQGNVTQEELKPLHMFIGVHHSIFEDPALFMAMGVPPFWLWIPRLLIAIITVRLYTFWNALRKRV
jgi:hypothetical protein